MGCGAAFEELKSGNILGEHSYYNKGGTNSQHIGNDNDSNTVIMINFRAVKARIPSTSNTTSCMIATPTHPNARYQHHIGLAPLRMLLIVVLHRRRRTLANRLQVEVVVGGRTTGVTHILYPPWLGVWPYRTFPSSCTKVRMCLYAK